MDILLQAISTYYLYNTEKHMLLSFWEFKKIEYIITDALVYLKRHFFIFLSVYVVILPYVVFNKLCCQEHGKKYSLFLSQFWKKLFLKQLKDINDGTKCKSKLGFGIGSRVEHSEMGSMLITSFKMYRTVVYWTIPNWSGISLKFTNVK